MANKIVGISGDEILDSRGYPTLRVHIHLESGCSVSGSVPAGASTGEGEAQELRDGDIHRYGGRGVQKALANLTEISPLLNGQDPTRQEAIDQLLVECDGTESKSRLGANTILGVSMAVARAGAAATNQHLYVYFAKNSAYKMPVPMMNVINGGHHASNALDFQEFMIVPHGAPSFHEGLRWAAETYHTLRKLLVERGFATGVGDEGGFAPDLESNEAPCALIVEAITRAGYVPGTEIALALDPAASSFWSEGSYDLGKSGVGRIDYKALESIYAGWTDKYPIASIGDGFGEHDWAAFREQTAELGSRIQIVGDDLYVTNRKLIEQGSPKRRRMPSSSSLIKLEL